MHKFYTSSYDASIYLQQPEQNAGRDEIAEIGGFPVSNAGKASRILTQYALSEIQSTLNGKVTGGQIGELYGIGIFVSTNCPVVETAAANSASTVDSLGALLVHRDALTLAEQQGVRSQTQYKQEFLANLFTSDTLYGKAVLRPEAGLTLVVPK